MAKELALVYGGYNTRPPALLNAIFMTTVNTAAKTLVAVASSAKAEHAERWKVGDHLRFVMMLMTWFAVWALRVLMDHFPCSVGPSHPFLLEGLSSVGALDIASSTSPCLDMILHEGSDVPQVKALGRALSHTLTLLNEIPATSRKYQFAVAMADKIVDQNAREGNVELLHINRVALSLAFSRTSGLLYRSLQSGQTVDNSGTWTSRLLNSIPLGSYVASYVKVISSILPSAITGTFLSQNQRQLALASKERADDVAAEKHAQELLWITNKMRSCDAVDEAVLQWSLASGLCSLSLTANPRVQGFIVKISALLLRDLIHANLEVPSQVKFRLLVLWLPLFCFADNGLAYPILTGYEKMEMERVMDDLISSLPALDQEVILTNWLQDFTICSSDWPNLQLAYDRWCQTTRKLIA
ncbi:hypothetical protein RJ640_029679 [Escallonia rubra]|uniref:At3g05675-like ankyrin-like domain-containing protein n=1 Tax=Escallonia rubra TaxID=112253 RepID=A0AA88U9G0_9ASTE|nr:hypothetical protein RJ640_029679 [Escallonia rubra]